MSEENKVIDKVNTSEIVEQLVETEAIPPLNTEPTHPVQPPVEPAQKLEDYYKETAEDRVAEEEYEQAVKDPQNRKEKIDQIKSIFHRSGEKKFSREEVILSKDSTGGYAGISDVGAAQTGMLTESKTEPE